MTRKNIIYLILVSSALIYILLMEILKISFLPIFYLLYIVFHIISLIFYRESKMITAFHILVIINLFGFYWLGTVGFSSFWGLVSLIGSISTILVAFVVILQHKTFKLTERSFMWFSIYNVIFYSLYTAYILNLLTNFFGPFPLEIQRTYDVFFAVRLVLFIGNVFLQILVVHRNEINKFLENEEKERLSGGNKISDLPFFK